MLRFDVISIDVYFVELLASTVSSAPHVLLELLPRVSHKFFLRGLKEKCTKVGLNHLSSFFTGHFSVLA